VIVRWGLQELPAVLRELEVDRPLLVASGRWSAGDVSVETAGHWSEVPSDRLEDAASAAADADALLPLGGGSAIDLAKAISAETGLTVVSVPTTYSGAEWTPTFGVRDQDRRMRGGGGGGRVEGIVYEPKLTLTLGRGETVGTSLNALAHCAEALYVKGHSEGGDARALEGAATINRALPLVVDAPENLEHRTELLHGGASAGEALALAGLALGHAMAQAVGGRYGLPHGALNAICLPAALRFNEDVAHDEIARFAAALETDDAAARVEELAALGGFRRLRDLGVPEDELEELAEAASQRAGARANPKPASPDDIAELLRSIW
jgi:maleylacetate reductase